MPGIEPTGWGMDSKLKGAARGVLGAAMIMAAGLLAPVAIAAPVSSSAPNPASPPSGMQSSAGDELACGNAINERERRGDLPAGLLSAIGQLESGRRDPRTGLRVAWPWTINVQGQGHYFATKADAVGAVRRLLAEGIGLIDVGCMQVNLYHHPTAFRSLDDAFDPAANVAYSAQFLQSLYKSQGSWNRAVAAYHSLTPELGGAYLSRVQAIWRRQGGNHAVLSEVWDKQPSELETAAVDFERGRYDDALGVYRRLLKLQPDHRVAMLGTALALDRQGHLEEARATYERVLALDPYNEVALDGIVGLIEKGPAEQRLALLAKVREIIPGSAEINARLAVVLQQQGRLAEAAGYLGQAADLEPDEPRYRLNQASLLDRAGDHAGAVAAYERFLAAYEQQVALTVSLDSVRKRLTYLKSRTP